jgi:hypothetical protein
MTQAALPPPGESASGAMSSWAGGRASTPPTVSPDYVSCLAGQPMRLSASRARRFLR